MFYSQPLSPRTIPLTNALFSKWNFADELANIMLSWEEPGHRATMSKLNSCSLTLTEITKIDSKTAYNNVTFYFWTESEA